MRKLLILGTRGVPAQHGGFETFAEQLSLYLIKYGWDVVVYCQDDRSIFSERVERWNGVTRHVFGSPLRGSIGSVLFDFRCMRDARTRDGYILVLGYNTGIFSALAKLLGSRMAINMDGIEWKRSKWSAPVRAWFWANERLAAWAGTVLIADHPSIARHLERRVSKRKIVTIPYGAPRITWAPTKPLENLGLESRKFSISICRIEPENSVLDVVRAFSAKERGSKLVVLGSLSEANPYHQAVRAAASEEVLFPGAIYEKETLASLRHHCLLYCHGHTVGGTNPSLVEALGAGCAVLAQDNEFNRWTAGTGQFYFQSEESCCSHFSDLLNDSKRLELARAQAVSRHARDFQMERIMEEYKTLITTAYPAQFGDQEVTSDLAVRS